MLLATFIAQKGCLSSHSHFFGSCRRDFFFLTQIQKRGRKRKVKGFIFRERKKNVRVVCVGKNFRRCSRALLHFFVWGVLFVVVKSEKFQKEIKSWVYWSFFFCFRKSLGNSMKLLSLVILRDIYRGLFKHNQG